MKTLIVVSFSVSADTATLYLQNGTTKTMKTNLQETKDILRDIAPVIDAGDLAEVTLSGPLPNPHAIIEKKSKGFIRFFRAAKSMFKPNTTETTIEPVKISVKALKRVATKVDEILDLSEDETIVAVVNDETVIPGIEVLTPHIQHDAKNDAFGMQKFLTRMSKMVDEREHTVQELLNFMSKGDLPIADDGSIIAYKVLNYEDGKSFSDCHSGNVIQYVGSRVSMAAHLVDQSRRQECSVGLHIARRGYLSGFSGSAMVLCKIAPEDVIAVPYSEPNKMRVCAYHIIAELNDEARRLLRNNKPMTSDKESAELLAQVIAGNHIDITNEVVINENYGGKTVMTPTKKAHETVPKPIEELKPAVALDDDPDTVIDPVTPKDVRKVISEKKTLKKSRTKIVKAIKSKPKTSKSSEMTDDQILAIKLVREGNMVKANIAKKCNTSTRTLGRWVAKFK
ncbi:MAG: hypothetical protein COA63_014225 [Methylophaga sp.]|nr:hypothetical protein [Methylophaga sp.]